MRLDDDLAVGPGAASAEAPAVVASDARAAPPRQHSGNLSDGGVYSCDDLIHNTAATVEVAFSGGEWHVSDPDAVSDAEPETTAEDAAAAADALKLAGYANWADLPDGIMREVRTSHTLSLWHTSVPGTVLIKLLEPPIGWQTPTRQGDQIQRFINSVEAEGDRIHLRRSRGTCRRRTCG